MQPSFLHFSRAQSTKISKCILKSWSIRIYSWYRTRKGINFVGLVTLSIQHIRLYQQPHSIKWSCFIWKVHQAQRPTQKLYIGIYICYHTLFGRDLVWWGSKHSEYSISSHMNNRKALKEVTLFGRCIKHSDQLGNIISGSTFVTTHLLDGVWFHGAWNTLNTVYQVIWTTIKQ